MIHELFEARAKEHPDGLAVESPDVSLTYQELDRKAEGLAAVLRRAGVGPDVRVGIFSDRTPDLFVGILGVLKAGGAYMCLDPGYPQERLLRIWEDLRAPVLLASRSRADGLPVKDAKVIPLDETTEASGDAAPRDPSSLAYMIFTSGSTGRPKGILLHHRGLRNLIEETGRLLKLGPGDRVLQFAALSFDVSVWETFTALSSGAALVLPGPSDLFLAANLSSILRDRKISTAMLPPSLMAVLPSGGFPDLHTVISVGERLSTEVVRRWAKGRRLINGYGPAEASITVSAFETRADGDYPLQGPPIGRPLRNVSIHLLGPDLKPVPDGAVGEMFVGGVQVARGYIGRPELDRERFISDPFAGGDARMYRTGDMARRLPDGDLEFAGREDTQVKIRGVRVELGEIEAVLASHPGVREALAVVREDQTGHARLTAFFSAEDEARPETRGLRRHMEGKLPRHVVPDVFVRLPELPRSPNGKLDRNSPVLQRMAKRLPSKLENSSRPARLWKPDPDRRGGIRCGLCPRACRIPDGGLGFCGVRANRGGELVTLNYGKSLRPTEEVIETEAVFHYAPGERILSLGNIGCNMSCDFCQNWRTSQARLAEDDAIFEHTPEQLVDLADRLGIRVLSWTYNDPVVWHEFVMDAARLARERGMKNLYKSAFYITPEAVEELLEVIDVFSVSLKSMDPDFYAKHTHGRLEPVLEGIKRVHGSGRHLELSNLVVTGRNDTLEESAKIARWMLDHLDAEVPLHYVRFHPDYKYTQVGRTSIPFMEEARLQAKRMGLRHVYLGNVLTGDGLDTRCGCGELLVRRVGLSAEPRLLPDGRCPSCRKDSGVALLSASPGNDEAARESEMPFTQHLDHIWEPDKLSVHVETSDGAPLFYRPLDKNGLPLAGFRRSRGGRFMISRSHPEEHRLRVYFKEVPPRILPLFDRANFPLR